MLDFLENLLISISFALTLSMFIDYLINRDKFNNR